jgi:hypothetical protein
MRAGFQAVPMPNEVAGSPMFSGISAGLGACGGGPSCYAFVILGA